MTKTPYFDPDAKWSLIPGHMHDSVERYVMEDSAVGGFLRCLFANDFMGAAGQADTTNRANLEGWAVFIYNHVPGNCHGSSEIVRAWQDGGGIAGGMR